MREVYKTLIAQGNSKNYHVFIIPVDEELNLKVIAKAVSEKKIEMIPVKDITKVSGYIRMRLFTSRNEEVIFYMY